MSLPLVMPLGAFGGWVAYWARNRAFGPTAAALILLPGGTLGWDLTAAPPVYQVHSAVVITAPPERVWHYVTAFPEIPEPHEWYF